MSTGPSDLRDLDSGWDDLLVEQSSAEDSAEDKTAMRPKPAVGVAQVQVRDREDPPTAPFVVKHEEARDTLPPPVPISELVAKMMSPDIDSSIPPRAPNEPFPRVVTPASPLPAVRPRRPPSSPSIETSQMTSEELFQELAAEMLTPSSNPRLDEIDDPAMLSEEPRSAIPRSSSRGLITRITPQPRRAFRSSEDLGPATSDRAAEPPRTPTPLGVPITGPASAPELRVKSDPFPLLHSERTPTTVPGGPPTERLNQVRDRYEAGDYSGALVIAEGLLEENPDHIAAIGYAESCREMLRQMYQSRIGEGALVPRVVVEGEQLRWLSLDHRAGFLLSCIDGVSCIDEILDVSGMPTLDALRILYELLQEGAIQLELPAARPRR